ncbi:MAG: hypothetical protein KIS79_01605, partial [Burkholderiales bacterium]|nr:hypothetical protein [Burkholderiales bacterium]
MTALSELVTTSERVSATASRLEKIALLAQLLRRLQADEVEIAVSYLTGDTGHARLGVGPASVFVAVAPRAGGESPGLLQVHTALAELGGIAGAGAVVRRKQRLGQLLALASDDEQAFLRRLLLGELRQGALEGVMLEAIAHAADLPVSAVRRAALVGGGLPAVAHAALSEGGAGLQRFALTLFRPLLPMLAQPAADVGEALEVLGTAAL